MGIHCTQPKGRQVTNTTYYQTDVITLHGQEMSLEHTISPLEDNLDFILF